MNEKRQRRSKMMSSTDIRILEFTEQYMEKIFYFCLKKTGNSHHAEDLSQDIALSVFSELRKERSIEFFPAWVWKIARNRYSKWAEHKHHQLDSESTLEAESEQMGEDSPEASLIHKEDIFLLRRELAFISSNYRDILVAYYIEERSVGEIAGTLSLPKGTVQSKLFRARTILKEGMTMARKFGTRSYNAEDIRFSASGNQPSGLPWSAVERKIPKNIILEAGNNPSTVEELSMALGIAVPYMEEEVELLRKATLLKKLGDKYITNFFIMSRECQEAIYSSLCKNSQVRSDLADRIANDLIPEIRRLGAVKTEMSDHDIKWWAFLYVLDICRERLELTNLMKLPPRENGETWGFVGYEICELPKKYSVEQNGNLSKTADFWAYHIGGCNLKNHMLGSDGAALMAELLLTKKKISKLSDAEKAIWNHNHMASFAHVGAEDTLIPDILVFEKGVLQKLRDVISAHVCYPDLMETLKKDAEQIKSVLKSFSTEVLREQLDFYVNMQLCAMRGMGIRDELETGKLLMPEDPDHSTIAMALYLK